MPEAEARDLGPSCSFCGISGPQGIYEVEPGRYLCEQDLAAAVQLAGMLWPDLVSYTVELEEMLSA